MLSVFLLGFLVVGLSACSETPAPTLKLSGFTMGTGYNITIVDPDESISKVIIQKKIDTRLASLNQQMSTYLESSELSRLNQAPSGQAIKVSPELFHVLLLSLETSWLTNGAFDVTVGPLVNLWGFGSEGDISTVPSDSAINKHMQLIGFQSIELNIGKIEITKKKPVYIDLSAIAKGYAVDQIVALLKEEGCDNFMAEIGGEIYVSGFSPRQTPWTIAIEQPDSNLRGIHRAISISGKAIATSGDYRNYFETAGKRYSHTISPLTGKPINHKLASVTVIADSVARADALATGINVMGVEQGLKLAEQQGLAVYLIVKTDEGFTAQYSDAFTPYLY